MKKIIKASIVATMILSCGLTIIPTQKASAGQSEFIAPLFSGYVEYESNTILLSQDVVIDMSQYSGVKDIEGEVGQITTTSNYTVLTTQIGENFCLPFLGTIEEINEIQITVNGQAVQAERFYGDIPLYFAGQEEGRPSILEAIESVQPTTINDGTAKLYSFAPIGGEIEFSFQKSDTQTVIHNGVSWSSQGVNGYFYKGQNSSIEEYPYQIFVSNGELIDFQVNVEYTVSDISYQNYVDYYLDEVIAEIGEEYRPYYYSQFNRSLSGNVLDVSDVLYDFSAYMFVLMKVELPVGGSEIVVNSAVSPLVNALYNPYVYIVRTVSPYQQDCAYSLTVKLSQNLPCILEENIGLSRLKYTAKKQTADGYFVVSLEEKIDYIFQENTKGKSEIIYICCALVLGTGAVIILIALRKKQKSDK